jgi:[protein-PII] uridylyltransferase
VFHKLTGALAGKGLRILSADINTLAHRLVLDRFFVHDPDFANEPPPERLNDVCQALVQSLHNDGAPSFRRVWRAGRAAAAVELPPLPAQVRIDNSTSERFTILDIFAADRLGLLYTISRALFELGLSVSVAKIGTYLDQVVDVFYVTDQHGQKINDEARLHEIRARLLEAIATIERHEREGIAIS